MNHAASMLVIALPVLKVLKLIMHALDANKDFSYQMDNVQLVKAIVNNVLMDKIVSHVLLAIN